MQRRSKASTKRRSMVDPTLEKPLLNLHAATDIDSFWKAVQQVIEAALPTCSIGPTLQHTPISNGAGSPSLNRTRAYRTPSFSGISTPNSFTDGFVALESAVGLSESSGL